MQTVLTLAALVAAAVAPGGPAKAPVAATPRPAVFVEAVQPHVHDDGHVHVHAEPVVEPVVEPVAVRPSTTRPVAKPGAMFRTPEAAMRYLAAAYNRNDVAAIKHVTTPDSRRDLLAMRSFARGLRLTSCKRDGGYYYCVFTHSYVKGTGRGDAGLLIAPADKPGWYVTAQEHCG